jgi:hypothetical protein
LPHAYNSTRKIDLANPLIVVRQITAVFTIALSSVSGKNITVDFATADETVIAGDDYTGTSGPSEFDSLAWACPSCNLHKSNRVEVEAPDAHETVPLFLSSSTHRLDSERPSRVCSSRANLFQSVWQIHRAKPGLQIALVQTPDLFDLLP